MNVVTFKGRAVESPEMRFTPNGKAVLSGTMAVQRKFKNANGDYEADFIDFVLWGEKQTEVFSKYINKGDDFAISGEMRTRMYENSEGRKVKVTECHVEKFDLPVRPRNSGGNNSQQSNQSNNQSNSGYKDDPFANDGKPIDISDDMLPF